MKIKKFKIDVKGNSILELNLAIWLVTIKKNIIKIFSNVKTIDIFIYFYFSSLKVVLKTTTLHNYHRYWKALSNIYVTIKIHYPTIT